MLVGKVDSLPENGTESAFSGNLKEKEWHTTERNFLNGCFKMFVLFIYLFLAKMI